MKIMSLFDVGSPWAPNEKSRLFRTHESPSVHLDHEQPLWLGTETTEVSSESMKGSRDDDGTGGIDETKHLMMEAMA